MQGFKARAVDLVSEKLTVEATRNNYLVVGYSLLYLVLRSQIILERGMITSDPGTM